MSIFTTPRVYRNMNHETYTPDDTQFDPDMATNDHEVTSPTAAQTAEAEARAARESNAKMKGKGKGDVKSGQSAPASSDDEEEEAKRIAREKKRQEAAGSEADDSGKSGTGTPRGGVPSIESATDSVFSQLLLESILEQKSVTDFVGGLPDKRGTLLVRFPTTLLGKSWKKRYFTLHGDSLYFHEEQAVIHPQGGMSAVVGGSQVNAGPNWDRCKKIDIANFWIIQQDGATGFNALAQQAAASGDPVAVAAAAAAAAAAANSGSSASASSSSAGGEKVYGGGQPIPTDDAVDPDGLGDNGSKDKEKSSKFDEIFKKGGDKDHKSNDEKAKKPHKNAPKEKKKEDGPVVRGRRRSSLVNEKGSTAILLIPKERGEDALELTGLNEGSMADLTTLNEWVVAINARIALLNFLHSPMNHTAMARGGREILAFLSDAQCRSLKIANRFTDLTPVLQHFHEALTHRSNVSFSFTNCAVTDAASEALANIVAANPAMVVERVDLSRNLLTKASMDAWHRALKANPHIRELVLDNNQIGDEGVQILVHGAAKDPASSSAASSAQPASAEAKEPDSDAAASAQTSFWSSGMSLDTLSLAGNQLSDRGLELLLTSVLDYSQAQEGPDSQGHGFKVLNFAGNQITDLGVQVLANFLLKNPRVHEVNIGANFITDAGAAALKAALASPSCEVNYLDLRENQITSAGLTSLLEGLDSLQTKRRVSVELSGNTGIDGAGLGKLLSLKSGNAWAAHITSLAFTVYDPEVLAARSAGSPEAVVSPRLQLSASAVPPAVASISHSQHDVLSLFSPTTTAHNSSLPQFPAGATQPAAAKVAPAPSSAAGSNASSRNASPATSGKKKLSKKEKKRASINDPSAPKIAISDAPLSSARGPKLAIQPLHPPPEFFQPQGSPEAEHSTPAGSFAAAETPSSTRSNGAIAHPAAGTPNVGDEQDDDAPHALLPAAMGERKPKGMVNS